MGVDFGVYLICIILIVLSLAVLSVIALSRRMKGRTVGKPQLITGGNVSALFDENRNVIVIPYVKDKFGVGRATGGPQLLRMPYSPEKLGAVIRHSMKLCSGGKPITSHELMTQLGFNAWKDFSQGKRSISINFMDGQGIVFNTTTRRMDGSYQFNHFGIEKSVGSDIGDKALGEIVLELLPKCKA